MAVKIVQVYGTTIATAATTLTITGLAGDTALWYHMRFRFVAGSATLLDYSLQFNGDAGSNYYFQTLRGAVTATSAGTGGYDQIYLNPALTGTDKRAYIIGDLYAKSGTLRTFQFKVADNLTAATATREELDGWVWNNTTSELTTITILSSTANSIGSGTVIAIYAQTTV